MLRVEGKGKKVRLVPVPLDQLIPRGEIRSDLICTGKVPYRKFFTGKAYTPHDLRAFFATDLANTVSIYELMDLLGHSNFNTTMKYIRRNPTVIKRKMHGYYERVCGANRSTHQEDSGKS